MSNKFFLPRGTADILPDETPLWQGLESTSRDILSRFGYSEIRTPLFEETELFARSMGQTSDIVQKQMLQLKAQGEENENSQFALRPEGTASIVRSYIQNDLDRKESLSKLYYIGPMFRGERPQKGRLRQFHQIGAEAIGPASALPYLDAEMIALAVEILKRAGIPKNKFTLKINTLGSAEDKNNFSGFLREKLKPFFAELCPDCQNRFERNVFRILDCKNRDCKAVVAKIKIDHSYLSEESRNYFSQVRENLEILNIQYVQDISLVRGLDYYTHTVFEISCPDLGSQDALGAGGRYGGLVSQLGGPQVDAIGFALGMERILLALGKETAENRFLDAFFVSLDEISLKRNYILIKKVREAGFSADMSYKLGSMKSQMRLADKNKARYVIILGQEELGKGVVTIKNMAKGDQQQVPLEDYGKIFQVLKN